MQSTFQSDDDPGFLMQKAKAGDSAAFAKIYDLYLLPVYRYIFLRTSDKTLTEDITQTVFLKAFSNLSNFNESERSPLGYFFTIARNTVIDYHRKKNFLIADEEEVFSKIESLSPTPEQQFQVLEKKEKLMEALAQLKDNYRDILILRYLNDFSNQEIAEMTGKSEDAIRQIQSRAIRKLAEILNNK